MDGCELGLKLGAQPRGNRGSPERTLGRVVRDPSVTQVPGSRFIFTRRFRDPQKCRGELQFYANEFQPILVHGRDPHVVVSVPPSHWPSNWRAEHG